MGDRRRDGGPGGGVGERRDPQHLVRRFDQRVHTALRLETGVRRPPADHDLERARSLAAGLDRPTVGARFEHQHVATRQRTLLDQRP